MKNKKRLALISFFVLLPLLGLSAILTIFVREMWIQYSMIEDIESRYGGMIVGEYHVAGSDHIEAITIVQLIHMGSFDFAGVKERDIVVSQSTIGQFLILLDQPPGSSISFDVVDGGNGPTIKQRTVRHITVVAP